MNAHQKRAWFMVGVGIAALVGYVALLPFVGAVRACAALGLFGIGGFTPLIGRKERSDERDRVIQRRAALAGGMVSYGFFIVALMAGWALMRGWYHSEVIAIDVLPLITCVGGIVCFLTQSVTVLVLYGRRVEADGA
jgi:hypothetical protein